MLIFQLITLGLSILLLGWGVYNCYIISKKYGDLLKANIANKQIMIEQLILIDNLKQEIKEKDERIESSRELLTALLREMAKNNTINEIKGDNE